MCSTTIRLGEMKVMPTHVPQAVSEFSVMANHILAMLRAGINAL